MNDGSAKGPPPSAARSTLQGAGRPCIRPAGSSRPTDGCDDCHGISEAWHRRRPGGPSRYSAATFRACRVTPTRATRGAAAPVTKHKKEPGVDARPVLVLSVQLSAAMNPRTGGARVGEAPRPFFPPISSGRNGGPGRAGPPRERAPPTDSGRPQVAPTSSAQAADRSLPRKRESSFPPLGLLLPTPTTSLGRRGGPIGCAGSSRPTGPAAAGQTDATASGRQIPRPCCRRRPCPGWRRRGRGRSAGSF